MFGETVLVNLRQNELVWRREAFIAGRVDCNVLASVLLPLARLHFSALHLPCTHLQRLASEAEQRAEAPWLARWSTHEPLRVDRWLDDC